MENGFDATLNASVTIRETQIRSNNLQADNTIKDLLSLDIPGGLYQVNKGSSTNFPEDMDCYYAYLEVSHDTVSNWRFLKLFPTDLSGVWMNFYNGYEGFVSWTGWKNLTP